MSNPEDTALTNLIKDVEQKAGRKMHTPKDFDYLHDCIYEQCHEMVSTSTLKRIWGYNKYGGTPRVSSLDPIARFIGYSNWDDYLEQHVNKEEEQNAVPMQKRPHKRLAISAVAAFISVIAITGGYLLMTGKSEQKPDDTLLTDVVTPSGKRVLRKGQDCFRTIDEYLSLFGMEAGDTAYFQPLPGYTYVYLWGPEYGHPVWHNKGDSTLLMPTITEYWTPLTGEQGFQSPEYVRLFNEKLYYERMEKDELRITFMKNIVDGFYVFLGIYRMDKELSSTEKTVWRRVADQCDLGNLNRIEQLREDKTNR